jgi:hypothetical protein
MSFWKRKINFGIKKIKNLGKMVLFTSNGIRTQESKEKIQ